MVEEVEYNLHIIDDDQFYTPLYQAIGEYMEDKGVDYKLSGGARELYLQPWERFANLQDPRVINLYLMKVNKRLAEEVIIKQLKYLAKKCKHTMTVYTHREDTYQVRLVPCKEPSVGRIQP